jgi:AmmeMemoRadiSam system protein B
MGAALPAEHHPVCYPSAPRAALDFFRSAFALATDLEMPAAPAGAELAGIVTPHIDFRVSRQAYAAAFAPLLREPLAELYLILGVGHRSHLEWNLDRRDYETPLGRAACAGDLVDQLAGDAEPGRFFEAQGHAGEHSIEFPLLWLQALHRLHPARGKESEPVRFVPLLCGGLHGYVEGGDEWEALEDFHRLSRALAEVFRMLRPGVKMRVVVSIDGCHLGPRFRHSFRVTPGILRETAAWEEELWSVAAAGDARALLDWFRAEGNDRYFDGVGALALLLQAAALSTPFTLQRTFYEQWFTERDASAVTFSSGRVLL